MATVNKDFKIKQGLVVEGTTATVAGNNILVANTQGTDSYITNLVGGVAYIKSVSSDFDVDQLGNLSINGASDLARTADLPTSADDLQDGSTNRFFSDYLAQTAVSNALGTGLGYGDQGIGNVFYVDENRIATRTYADDAANTAYTNAQGYAELKANDAYNSAVETASQDATTKADAVQANLTNHRNSTSAHGVAGDIVGTSDQQTLTNKTIADNLIISDGQTFAGTIGATQDGKLAINASQTLYLHSDNSDIELVSGQGHHVYINGTSAGNEVATHSYVDNAVSGLNWKQAVNLLSTTNVDISGAANPWPIDSHAKPTENYRILLTGQTDAFENGIWVFDAMVETFSRPADADTHGELVGAAVFVMEGTTYGGSSWVQANHYLSDFGNQDWTQFSGTGTVTAGTGITVNGLEVSVNRTTVDGWYDAAGSADTVQTNLTNHRNSTSVHGVTGNVVGTTDTQTLTNKTIDGATLTGSVTLDGTGDFTITSDSNIVLDPNTTAYLNSATTGNEIATQGYVDNAVDNVTIDLSTAAGAYIDWNPSGTGTYDVNVSEIITDGDIATNSSVTSAINALDTDAIEEGGTNKYASTTNVVAALTDQPSIIDLGTTELSADKFSGGDISGTQGTFQSVKTDTIYSDNLSMQRNSITGSIATADTVGVLQIGAPTGRAIKVMIKLTSGSHAHVWEALLAIDASQNVAVTEYAEVTTNGVLGSLSYPVTSDGKGGYYVELTITTLNSNTNYKILTESF